MIDLDLDLDLNRNSPVPVAVQISEAIVRLIHAGVLRRGHKLPAVRALATAAGVNRNTVQRIYRELTSRGVLETHVGDGTYVAAAGRPEAAPMRPRARECLREALETVLRLGFSPEEVAAMMQVEFAVLVRRRAAQGTGLVRSRTRFSTWGKYSGTD